MLEQCTHCVKIVTSTVSREPVRKLLLAYCEAHSETPAVVGNNFLSPAITKHGVHGIVCWRFQAEAEEPLSFSAEVSPEEHARLAAAVIGNAPDLAYRDTKMTTAFSREAQRVREFISSGGIDDRVPYII